MKQLFEHLERLPWWLGIFSVIFLFTTFALVAIFAMRRNSEDLKGHHDVSGFVFANLGVLYSVLLGFTVVNVQARFDKIAETSRIEAAALSELYRDAQVFSEKDRDAIQAAIRAYTRSVLKEEWDVLHLGKSHPSTEKYMNRVWEAFYNVDISTLREQILYADSIRKLGDTVSARLSRLLGGEESLGEEMWTMLILGGLLIVAFMCMFTFETLWLHLLLAFLLAASISFPLFLIYSLDSAFSGRVRLEPEAFRDVLKTFDANNQNSP